MPVYRLSAKLVFPPVHLATREGLLAVGGDLCFERLLLAYKSGIFPWYSDEEPILWWSPDPRLVLYPEEFQVSKSLAKTIRQGVYRVTMDTAFEQVISACARTRLANGIGTWITPEMKTAYCRLHERGYAHSVEAWRADQLAGGLYGVSLGRVFFGESMFSAMSNASKVCLVYLVQYLKERCFDLIDCQVTTNHLLSMGAHNIPRDEFITQLHQSVHYPSKVGPWMNAGSGR
ncbi:MAG: leucyl/phenylalanyl-tRNA--protein transferase [Desulfatitalea sp.]